MAVKIFSHDINVDGNVLLNARHSPISTIERNTLGSTLNPMQSGMIVYDTDEEIFYGWNGNDWFPLNITGSYLSQFRDAVDNVITDISVTGGIEKTITLERNSNASLYTTFLDGYEYTQSISDNIWIINHSLNKYPSVSVTDTANTVVYGSIEYIDINTIQLTFSKPFSGKAFLN